MLRSGKTRAGQNAGNESCCHQNGTGFIFVCQPNDRKKLILHLILLRKLAARSIGSVLGCRVFTLTPTIC
jgi:hypothetical protein